MLTNVSLPTPSERPDAVVLIYDGKCRFCVKQVARINRWDSGGRIAYLSLHDAKVADCYPDLTHAQLMQQMYVIDQAGNRYGGAEAFRYLSRLLPTLWFLAPWIHLPFSMPLWQWLYRQFAQRRYRNNPCKHETCHGSGR